MARSKAVARKPKSATGNQNEIKAGRVEKPEQTSTKENPALKAVVNKTPKEIKEFLNQKKKRPISKKNKRRNKAARESLASGELAAEDLERRKERDLRTLYVRFKDKEKLPENPETVKNLHADIQVVRMPRQVQKRIQYAYLEFNSETKCEEAKLSIQKNDGFYVDYVGLKSKGGGTHQKERGSRGKGKTNKQVNPTRLFITGLIEGMTEDKLKELFPKCYKANIPKGSIRKGTLYGFVQFHSPADAKSAFEAAKKLTLQTKEGKEAQRITVLYATASNHPPASTKDEKSEKNEPKLQQINTENSPNVTTTKTKNEVESKDAEMKDNEAGDEESEDESEELENDKESENEDNEEIENDEESEDEADQAMENDAESDDDESSKENSDAGDQDGDSSSNDDVEGSDE